MLYYVPWYAKACNSPRITMQKLGVISCSLSLRTDPPTISSLTYQGDSQTLTCVSTGSPPTVVEWMKNGQPLTINGSLHSLSQTVTDRAASTYDNTLTVSETVPGGMAGTYTCNVSNILGSVNMTVEVVCELDAMHSTY